MIVMPDPSKTLRQDVYTFIRTHIYPTIDWPWFETVVEHWIDGRKGPAQTNFTDLLPGLIYISLGGATQRSIPLTAAWLFYILGAKVLDDVQDGDADSRLWTQGGLQHSIPLGTALITAPNICLSYLDTDPLTIRAILGMFGQIATTAAKGQSQPTNDYASLEIYFAHIVTTTAQLFAAGAWVGGRLHTDDEMVLNPLYEFGHGLGMKTAIVLDCLDLQPTDPTKPSDIAVNSYKLPVIYGVTRCTASPHHTRLLSLLAVEQKTAVQVTEILDILTEIGAVRWSLNLATQFQHEALAALSDLPTTKEALLHYV